MKRLPARRGCLHFGALSLAILFGACGLVMGVWGCTLSADIWLETVGRSPQYTEADVLSNPADFMVAVQKTRETRFHALKTVASFCSAANRILILVLIFAVISAATTPGSDPRRRAWIGVAGMTVAFLLFYAGSRMEPANPPLPAVSGRELYELIGTERDRMETTVNAFFALAVATTIFFGVITLRSALRLWREVREERRRGQEVLLIGQFK